MHPGYVEGLDHFAGLPLMITLNMGNVDRALRLVLGIVLVALAALGYLGAWAYVGVVLALTGLVAYCPLYSVLGIRTTSR